MLKLLKYIIPFFEPSKIRSLSSPALETAASIMWDFYVQDSFTDVRWYSIRYWRGCQAKMEAGNTKHRVAPRRRLYLLELSILREQLPFNACDEQVWLYQ